MMIMIIKYVIFFLFSYLFVGCSNANIESGYFPTAARDFSVVVVFFFFVLLMVDVVPQ